MIEEELSQRKSITSCSEKRDQVPVDNVMSETQNLVFVPNSEFVIWTPACQLLVQTTKGLVLRHQVFL